MSDRASELIEKYKFGGRTRNINPGQHDYGIDDDNPKSKNYGKPQKPRKKRFGAKRPRRRMGARRLMRKYSDVEKANPNHDPASGRFTTGGGGAKRGAKKPARSNAKADQAKKAAARKRATGDQAKKAAARKRAASSNAKPKMNRDGATKEQLKLRRTNATSAPGKTRIVNGTRLKVKDNSWEGGHFVRYSSKHGVATVSESRLRGKTGFMAEYESHGGNYVATHFRTKKAAHNQAVKLASQGHRND